MIPKTRMDGTGQSAIEIFFDNKQLLQSLELLLEEARLTLVETHQTQEGIRVKRKFRVLVIETRRTS